MLSVRNCKQCFDSHIGRLDLYLDMYLDLNLEALQAVFWSKYWKAEPGWHIRRHIGRLDLVGMEDWLQRLQHLLQ